MLKNAGLQYQGLAPSQGVNSETATCLSSGLRILWEVCGYSVLLGCHRLLKVIIYSAGIPQPPPPGV